MHELKNVTVAIGSEVYTLEIPNYNNDPVAFEKYVANKVEEALIEAAMQHQTILELDNAIIIDESREY